MRWGIGCHGATANPVPLASTIRAPYGRPVIMRRPTTPPPFSLTLCLKWLQVFHRRIGFQWQKTTLGGHQLPLPPPIVLEVWDYDGEEPDYFFNPNSSLKDWNSRAAVNLSTRNFPITDLRLIVEHISHVFLCNLISGGKAPATSDEFHVTAPIMPLIWRNPWCLSRWIIGTGVWHLTCILCEE